MKIAVLSGKGGTGKTFVSVNLAYVCRDAEYIDCDVEEPNGFLFLKPESITEEQVFLSYPSFDAEKCVGCQKCADFCQYNALAYIKDKPMLFPDICHFCGGCILVCPNDAAAESKRQIGVIRHGYRKGMKAAAGVLNTGETFAMPVVKSALRFADSNKGICIIDCPPGSGCQVQECIAYADYCILVAEPTEFGFHNFRMVYKLISMMGKPCCVIINKEEEPFEKLDKFCEENHIEILLRIKYDQEAAELCSAGVLAGESNQRIKEIFVPAAEFLEQRAEI
ncbi:MAG TPA: ATP-binding protein [Methanocorpusculum sp.]|nr:ATP-binding protein [Methanocorpusculum sp.]